jgi:hypothetical protein
MKKVNLSPISKLLRKPWYFFWNLVERKLYQGHSYTLHVPYGQRILTPWFEDSHCSEFTRLLQKVRQAGPLAVSVDRCYILYQFALRCQYLKGDIAECGVYTGGTAHLLAYIIASNNYLSSFHLFDTFTGMPDTANPERDYHSVSDFSDTSLDYVQRRLGAFAAFCKFHPGFIPETFAEVKDVFPYSLVHVDVDIYPSVMDTCTWFWDRLCVGGTMIFDDYGFYPYRYAARSAVDEFFADKPGQVIILPTGQAVAIKSG